MTFWLFQNLTRYVLFLWRAFNYFCITVIYKETSKPLTASWKVQSSPSSFRRQYTIITYCECLDGLTFSSVDHHSPPLLTSFSSCSNLKESSKDLFSICIMTMSFVKFSFICSFCYLFFFFCKRKKTTTMLTTTLWAVRSYKQYPFTFST